MRALAEQEPLLIFRVGPVLCCAPVRDVDSIVIPQQMNHLPGQAPDVAGVFQYRSHTVSVHRLHTKFGLPPIEDETKGRVIMAYTHKGLTGFWADDIEEITSGYETHWSEPPKFVGGNIFDKTLQWHDKMVLHTDFDKLVAMQDAAPLQSWISEHGTEIVDTGDVSSDPQHGQVDVVDLHNDTDEVADSHEEELLLTETGLDSLANPETPESVTGSIVDDSADAEIEDTAELSVDATFEEDEIADKEDVFEQWQEDHPEAEQSDVVDSTEVEEATEDLVTEVANEDAEETAAKTSEQESAEVDTELYNEALAALDKEPQQGQEAETDTNRTSQEQLQTGELSSLLNRNESLVESQELEQETPDTMDELTEQEEASAPSQYERVEDLEPMYEQHTDNSSFTQQSESDIDLREGAFSTPKLIGGVSALVLVAAIGGYLIFSGDSNPESTSQDLVVEQTSSTEIVENSTPEIAELVLPDDGSNAYVRDTEIQAETNEQLMSDSQDNTGAIGAIEKTEALVEEDKPTDLIPLETAPTPPLKPLEPQLPVWGVHVVSKGDTLWALANRYLNNPFRYIELAQWSDIKNPDRIYPGESVKYKDERGNE